MMHLVADLSPHACDALVTLIGEPLWRRHGVYVRSSQFASAEAAGFAFTTIGKLTRRRLITVRPRRAPRRYEVQLTADGRAAAAAALALQAEALAAEPGAPLA